MGLVVDTSAVMAVLLDEPGAADLVQHLDSARPAVMSAGTRVELGIVAEARLGAPAGELLHRLLRDARVTIVDVDPDLAERAISAWRRFGRGRHPAGLNYGDCFAYALADRTGYPLLCTGDDFARTDLPTVRPTAER